MKYMTVKEASAKWGISERMTQQLCTSGRIEGADKFGGSWAIPVDAEKPGDPRKNARSNNVATAKEEPSTAVTSARVAMPLLNAPFRLGSAKDTVEMIEDPVSRDIARAEYYYFSGQSEKASIAAEPYLGHEDVAIKLSACWIYAYANLALDRVEKSRMAMAAAQTTLAKVDDNTPIRDKALAVCVTTGASVLLHLPLPKILSPLKTYIHMLPPGLRLFVLYIEAHHSYLNKYYGAAIGIAETALALEGEIYPIANIYLHLVACMGYMNLKRPEEAKGHFMEAWALAQPDDLIEALAEHHGLIGGILEATLKKDFPEDFKRIINITYKFSAGWRKIHNPDTGRSVADNLTTTEFAAAMLAARDWTNQEIASHMGISEHTVKHYISTALQKLNISQRKELQKFLLH